MGAPPPPPVTAVGPERWYIYREGTGTTGPYHALNKRIGVVVYTGSSLDEVLDPVLLDVEAGDQSGTVTSFLSSGGHIYIDGTDVYYSCSAGFDGFTLPPYTTIEGPHNARILVPNTYASYVFKIPSWHAIDPTKWTSSTTAVTIKGMSLHEAGAQAREWTGIQLDGEAENIAGVPGGISGCRVEGTRINLAKRGLYLRQVNTAGWINACWFEKLYIAACKYAGVDQDFYGGADPVSQFGNNVFRDVIVQSHSATDTPVYGFRNMGHLRCIYDNCQVWDVVDGQIKATFDTTTSGGVIISEDNLIIGGILADSTTPPAGTFSGGHGLVTLGYYAAGAAYPAKYQDGVHNTNVVGDYITGNQFSKIYVPATGGIGGTGILSIEARNAAAAFVTELISGSDSFSTVLSWYNNSKSERMTFSRTSSQMIMESIRQTAGGTLRPIVFRMNDVPGGVAPEAFRILINGDIQIADTRNIVLNATTGTKIGTATTQKLGFFNKTPIAQKAAIVDTSSGVVATVETEVNKLKQLLRDYGLMA